ncbi:hypothetical protein GETHLI_16240 [Geothrix limicola]|uniref:Outer membrane protein beta-barrel domain-containing protein n=1 Tax=Geothrix limicola TaxID=2927978 RepID=A0ABQ5QEP1_9BACT|nr:hypothetical protein [Geothrix limicola]GLH73122.1 hypothetical protein GETHLI_16240 [Geothrix limicola]
MTRSLRSLVLILAAGLLPVAAQEAGAFSAALSLAQGTDAMKALTGSANGFALDGAWDSPSQGLPFRVGLSAAHFSDATHTRSLGLDANGDPQTNLSLKGPALTTFQAYAALRVELATDLNLYLGLSANRHHLSSDLVGQGGSQYVVGTKLGTRVDLEYRVAPRWAALGSFQWVELGQGPSGNQFLNPSWFQLGVRHTF